jgi:virulence-associated protein VapD
MYAIAFDLRIDDLKKTYGEPYNGAYDEIKRELGQYGFEWTQGSLYINRSTENTLVKVFNVIDRLKEIDWFVNSVRDIRAFKVEDWSDFTQTVKKNSRT